MEITNKVHALKIPFQIPITPKRVLDRFVFVYIFFGEKIYLVDSGVKGSDKIIFDYIEKLGRSKKEISKILLTHSHPDHIGSLKSIKEQTGCSVLASNIEADWIEDTNKQFFERPVPGFHSLVEGPVKIDQFISDKETIRLEDGLTLEVILTPGHSEGSITFYFKEEQILITGDAVLLPGELPIFTNVEKYFSSINKLKSIENIKILLSSWDEPRSVHEIKNIFNSSFGYVKKIREAANKVSANNFDTSSMDFCFAVLDELKLPRIMANPLLLKSFRVALN